MKNKLIYLLIFLLGGLVFATGTKIYLDSQKNSPQAVVKNPNVPKRKSFFERFFDDDFFNDEAFDQLANQMAQGMQGISNGPGPGQIEIEETDQFIIYKIRVDQITRESLNVNIQNGQITISGQAKIEKENQGQFGTSKSISISSFHKSFPAPSGVKTEEVQMENKDDFLVLKFPKVPKI